MRLFQVSKKPGLSKFGHTQNATAPGQSCSFPWPTQHFLTFVRSHQFHYICYIYICYMIYIYIFIIYVYIYIWYVYTDSSGYYKFGDDSQTRLSATSQRVRVPGAPSANPADGHPSIEMNHTSPFWMFNTRGWIRGHIYRFWKSM